MTAWDCLRTDWTHLTEAVSGDTRGRVEVHTDDGGTITVTHLDDLSTLAGTLRELTLSHPDPLEIVIRAEHDEKLLLRSRHRRDGGATYQKPRENNLA
jgi:hypothetical protein